VILIGNLLYSVIIKNKPLFNNYLRNIFFTKFSVRHFLIKMTDGKIKLRNSALMCLCIRIKDLFFSRRDIRLVMVMIGALTTEDQDYYDWKKR
jgi:hypothetical protein